ncbi:unnamed protein product [Didymodactylos carnosus]|uniref:Uncharacterized protein n=1 Tax=Didymodactylos carnosus TaxID=1234261 RepID=A0A815D3K6_9BILA|nr:unnamed protein product [Didymodactylos carnosus]CAF4100569.1 unnamed protein product [Didymodactylos carnosus]
MTPEQDPYALIKYINVINVNNDGSGDPTIHAFVEMGLLTIHERLICTINNTSYECYIHKNENDEYVLCYQNNIQDGNVMKFIIKLSKLIKIKIRYMGVSFGRIRRVSDNRTLLMLLYDLKETFEKRITTMLISSEFGIWEIHTSYDFNNKKVKFICRSNMKYDDILQIINNANDMNHDDIDDDIYKEKQQLDEDIIKFDSGSSSQSRNPVNVLVSSLHSLLNRHKPNKVTIFKYGAATNLTMGFIKEIDTTAILDNTHYSNLIEVEWTDATEFALGGDSGSLYFVYNLTTNAFVPVAMHVGSKQKKSYGILISYIF